MPFNLSLPRALKLAGWKVKIRDAERLEVPHVTIMHGLRVWRLSLRSGEFLERGQSWKQIDKGVRKAIEEQWARVCEEWDKLYPQNPISSEDDD